jgi:hypothetical protein
LRDAEQSLGQMLPQKAQDKLNQARDILESIGSSDNETFARVYSGLATCQIQKTWKKGLAPEEYVRYLERAQHYAIRGLDFSGPSAAGEEDRTCPELEDVRQRCVALGVEYPVPSYKR